MERKTHVHKKLSMTVESPSPLSIHYAVSGNSIFLRSALLDKRAVINNGKKQRMLGRRKGSICPCGSPTPVANFHLQK